VPHDTLQDIARSDAFDRFSRFGWAVKGFIFGMIGVLALLTALGEAYETTDPRGALDLLGGGVIGTLVLSVVGLGLVCYGMWRISAAVLDVEGHGSKFPSLARRAVFFGIGCVYLTLAFTLGEALFTTGDGPDGETDYDLWAFRALQLPGGEWLVGAAGVATIIAGLVQFVAAYNASFLDYWAHEELTEKRRFWLSKIGRFGYAARGVVFLLLGYFLIRAGAFEDSDEARNVGETLGEMGGEPWALGIVGFGFIAFGVHCFLDARYRHISVDRGDRYDDGHDEKDGRMNGGEKAEE
jgi:hypothetical protein